MCPVRTGKVVLLLPVDVLFLLYKRKGTKKKTCGYVYLLRQGCAFTLASAIRKTLMPRKKGNVRPVLCLLLFKNKNLSLRGAAEDRAAGDVAIPSRFYFA